MTDIILPAFDRYPQEAAIIGRLLAGYGELEFELYHCIAGITGDFDTVFKVMFRPRGEKQRIDIADSMGRTRFRDVNLGNRFSEAVGDMRYCLKIRNQYAHCTWHNDYSGRVGFVQLEEIAFDNNPIDLTDLTTKYLDISVLTRQRSYFEFLKQSLAYLNFEGRLRTGKLSIHHLPNPKKVERPPLSLP